MFNYKLPRLLERKENGEKYYFYGAFFFLLLFGIFIYGIKRIYGFVLYPDEFGYWVHGAKVVGMDWSEVAGIHPYYSFGIGFLMAPLILLIENPIALYRTMIGFNFLMLCGSGILLYRILCKLIKNTKKEILLVISGVCTIYSSFLVYVQTTLPEILLVFLYLAIILLYLEIIESARLWKMILLAVLFAFIYVAHMRTVGIVLAGLIMLGALTYQRKKMSKNTLWMLAVLVLLLVGGTVMKSFYKELVFLNAESFQMEVNDYGGQIEKIKSLFSISGIINLGIGLIGKIFYLGCSTFGLFYWGFITIVQQWKHSKRSIFLFLLLSTLFTVGITAVYNINTDRVDGLLYGRYNEMILPILMAFGLIGMFKSRELWKGAIKIICINSICILVLNYAIEIKGIATTNRHSIIGVAYALALSDNSIFKFTRNAYLGGCAALLITTLLVYGIRKYQWNICLLLIITFLQLMVGFHSCNSLNYTVNENRKDDIDMAMKVKQMCGKDQNVVYMFSEGYGYVDILQFCLREKKVNVRIQESAEIEQLNLQDIVVTYPEDIFLESLSDNYNSMIQSTHFNVYYNEER